MNSRFIISSLVAFGALLLLGAVVPAKKRTLIIAIGDSTTAGAPYFKSPLESHPDGEGDPEGQYAYWIMRRRPQWEVRNFGISGETSDQIRARLDYPLRSSPRYIIILAGVNDIFQGVPLKKTSANLYWMYEHAKTQSTMPVAVTVPPFDQATAEQAENIDILNRWIIKSAEKLRIPVADVNTALRDPKDPHKLIGSPDGLHPDVGGYRKMAIKIIEAITPIEKAWR